MEDLYGVELSDDEMVRFLCRKYWAHGKALRERLGVQDKPYAEFDAVDKLLLAHSVSETLKVRQEIEALKERFDAKTDAVYARYKRNGSAFLK